MNKAEIVADLKARDFIKIVFDVKLIGEEDGVNLYEAGFFEAATTELAAIKRSCHFYVLDENEDTEQAFYKDREPSTTIREKNHLVIQYADAIKSLKLKVAEENDSYIVCEGYEKQADNSLRKVRYIADTDEYNKMYVD